MPDMARIRHLAMSTDDPAKTAEFFKTFFGLRELFRKPADTGAQGVWLSDGYIYFAIIKYGSAEMPKRDEPKSIGIIHHIGFNVENLEATCEALNAAHVTPNEFIPPNRPMETYSREANRK